MAYFGGGNRRLVQPVMADGLKMSRSSVSSSAIALCGTFDGMSSTWPLPTTTVFALNMELQRAFHNVGDLLGLVMVLGHYRRPWR
jgi:hypothetical protein